ncbi:MAG: type II toxin-antitoxin system Phd/YefM family antitoxin [Selenomonadaceae bacterium]|nr:type II toxin-antitoxin system Phd/YefM family antitoxin [Selenomonadaceae bacterium]MBQ1511492.1 type II toxin-antitoxin system Phd/YefM family antitoxin [Selenomonadaceae bacterium]MBQ1913910.1 type II toxin-antitoxin system Phd/YefM family antitoxin [Selenomonadaceae bacterium]MBQ3970789.1 type II toxin-antitoxin system Phd/YefM family antitoxin [Selenomonadaceae bacterium]
MQIAIGNTLPFSSFMAQAKQIFAEVQTKGPRIITEEGHPSCVLLSHAEYERIMDELADAELNRMAAERLAKPRTAEEYISQEEIDKEFGFTEENLKGWEEVEIG